MKINIIMKKSIIFITISLAVIIPIFLLFNPAVSKTFTADYRMHCSNNLKSISSYLSVYQNEYGTYPKPNGEQGLKELFKITKIVKGFFVCPKDKKLFEWEKSFSDEEGKKIFHSDYIYLGGFKDETTLVVPILFDKISNHKDYCNVLFSNRKIRRYKFPYSSYEKLIDYIIEKKHCKKEMRDILNSKIKIALKNNSIQ